MIKIITAMTKKGIIGKGNQLPWNIPDELKNFKLLTQGHTVIMGKRTFESIGRPLPNRHNIVLDTTEHNVDGVQICTSAEQALSMAKAYGKDVFVIGGAYTYAQFLHSADELYVSYIKQDYDGDVFFPPVNWHEWIVKERKDFSEFEFVLYQRKE